MADALFRTDLPDPPLAAAVGAEVDGVSRRVPLRAVVLAGVAGDLQRLLGVGQIEHPDVEVVAALLIDGTVAGVDRSSSAASPTPDFRSKPG